MKRKSKARKCAADSFPWPMKDIMENIRLVDVGARDLIHGRITERLTFRELATRIRVGSPGSAKRAFRAAVFDLEKVMEWKGVPTQGRPEQETKLELEKELI